MTAAGAAIREYAERTRHHRPRFVYDEVVRDTIEVCDVEAGDRCDIIAAYRHAADIADGVEQ